MTIEAFWKKLDPLFGGLVDSIGCRTENQTGANFEESLGLNINMKFPTFSNSNLAGLTACGHLLNASQNVINVLSSMHSVPPFMVYKAGKRTANALILGGAGALDDHMHVDIFTSELLAANEMSKPAEGVQDVKKQEFSKILDGFLGVEVSVRYDGIFLVEKSALDNGRLLQMVRYGESRDSGRYIEMNSARFDLVGFPVQSLSWKLVQDELVRVKLSFRVTTVIDNDYLVSPIKMFVHYFDLFGGLSDG